MLCNLRKSSASDTEAFKRAVGGKFREMGAAQAALILELAPESGFHLIDVGCGSGRLAHALRDETRVTYTGFDILPDLADYAREICNRPDWRFETISSLALPAPGAVGDIIVFMSVFTHLKPAEIKTYLAEALRVLKPGGRIVASYLDPKEPGHVQQYHSAPVHYLARLLGRDVMRTRMTQRELANWMEEAGLTVERTITESPLGQHVLVARKPAGANPA